MITSINEFKVIKLNEASFDQLQQQFVDTNKISTQIFDDIKKNIIKSAYATWIIKQILNNNILPEDVYKYKEYFNIFDNNKKLYDLKDINQYKTKTDINKFLSKTLEIKQLNDSDKSTIKGQSKENKYINYLIGSTNLYNIYMLPQNDKSNYNISCDLGSGTEWCTATGNTSNYFNEYIEDGPLFIIINKSNSKDKFQFSFETNSFMDKNDNEIFNNEDIVIDKLNDLYPVFELIKNKYNYEIPFEILVSLDKPLDYDNLTDNEWIYLSTYKKLSEDIIREYKDKVDWYDISIYQKLSEDFIREFKDRVNWIQISRCQKLSEDFIREFQDRVDWKFISISQKLSEDFIREFQDKVDWTQILKHQKLSPKFKKEFKNKL